LIKIGETGMVHMSIITKGKQNLGASFNIKNKAKELRRNLTKTEKILWNHLRKKQQNGMYFRRQHPYGIYILDFYCFKANLAIEVDGEIHLCRKEYDEERTRYLESSGLRVLRFSNEEVEKQIEFVIDVINKYISTSFVDQFE
jgi:very-short-patch-repair endonuclease